MNRKALKKPYSFTFYHFLSTIKLALALILISNTTQKASAKTFELTRTQIKSTELSLESYLEANNIPLRNWQHKDYAQNQLLGVSWTKAYQAFPQLAQGKEVIVAVIDSGIDINHKALQGKIWVNHREIPNNNIDDDNNGYIDDYMGWNFLGSQKGAAHFEFSVSKKHPKLVQNKNVLQFEFDTLEITRKFIALRKKQNRLISLSESELTSYNHLKLHIQKRFTRAKNLFDSYSQDVESVLESLKVLSAHELTQNNLSRLSLNEISKKTSNHLELKAVEDLLFFLKQGGDVNFLKEQAKMYQAQYQAHYNIDFSSREELVGDDPHNLSQKGYGNNDVIGPDPVHGTHVAGIIAASSTDHEGSPNTPIALSRAAKIMPIRAIPNGDERDKDIANAIYYAVNNGAHIINMSFAKHSSPHEKKVQKALAYAKERRVLIVRAAGNNYLNLDQKRTFPHPSFKGRKLDNFILVGASTPNKDETVFSDFSNYGKESLDFLAPGTYIYSTIPNNKYASMSGTSMAAPVASAIAANLLSLSPGLSPKKVKSLLVQGMTPLQQLLVFKADLGSIPLKDIMRHPGVVNMFQSIKLLLDTDKKTLL